MFVAPPSLTVPVASSAEVRSIPATTTVAVPFFSQFKDITSPKWQKVGCGIASVGMIIEFYKPNSVTVNTLLTQGIAAGAYLPSAGWTYKGLIGISKKYGLDGQSYDLGKSDTKTALAEFTKALADGPVIASVHYKFDPKSTVPHLVVITKIADGRVYYNDPAAKTGELQISTDTFLKAWKKRYIILRPASTAAQVALTNTR